MSWQLAWSIIKQFSLRNKYGFTFQEVVKEFPEKNISHLGRILSEMVLEGMLCKVAHDYYHIIPMNADPESYVPDGLQIVKYIMQDRVYYIGYVSALKIHGLASENNNTDPSVEAEEVVVGSAGARVDQTHKYVVTLKQIKPAIKTYLGTTCHFLKHSVSRFFGFESVWINKHEKVVVSDLEKTIVDIATAPQLCGGITELGKVLFQAKDRIDPDKLFGYFSLNANMSAKKRFLYLSDLLALNWTDKHDKLLAEVGTGISMLDPSIAGRGRKWGKFGLELNVDPIKIKNTVLNRNFGMERKDKA